VAADAITALLCGVGSGSLQAGKRILSDAFEVERVK